MDQLLQVFEVLYVLLQVVPLLVELLHILLVQLEQHPITHQRVLNDAVPNHVARLQLKSLVRIWLDLWHDDPWSVDAKG